MFPRLEVLSIIGAISIHTCHNNPFATPSPFYPSLRELKLQGLDSKMCLFVLRHLSSPSGLVSFDLDTTKEYWDGFECTLLMQCLARCPNLHTIRLQGNLAIEGSDFALLLNLRKVQQLEVPSCNDFRIAYLVLRRLDLARLAHAWRDIRTLHIGWIAVSTADDYLPSLSDLYALRTLRDSCPKLESLIINLDGQKDYTDLLTELCKPPLEHHSLKTPKIGPASSPTVTNPPTVVMILALLSPQLTELITRKTATHDPWRMVAGLLPAARKPLSEDEIQPRILYLSSVGAENVRVAIPFVLDTC